jgi:hypothetical protein
MRVFLLICWPIPEHCYLICVALVRSPRRSLHPTQEDLAVLLPSNNRPFLLVKMLGNIIAKSVPRPPPPRWLIRLSGPLQHIPPLSFFLPGPTRTPSACGSSGWPAGRSAIRSTRQCLSPHFPPSAWFSLPISRPYSSPSPSPIAMVPLPPLFPGMPHIVLLLGLIPPSVPFVLPSLLRHVQLGCTLTKLLSFKKLLPFSLRSY